MGGGGAHQIHPYNGICNMVTRVYVTWCWIRDEMVWGGERWMSTPWTRPPNPPPNIIPPHPTTNGRSLTSSPHPQIRPLRPMQGRAVHIILEFRNLFSSGVPLPLPPHRDMAVKKLNEYFNIKWNVLCHVFTVLNENPS